MSEGTGGFRVADARVRAATGASRAHWFAVLDAADGRSLGHAAAARLLTDQHGLDGWWAHTVVVDYEQHHGLRTAHERSDGFAASKSKTVGASIAAVFQAWADDARRATWLDGELAVTATREPRSVRGRWNDGPERVAVWLTEKGPEKTVVQVEHERLPDAEAVTDAKQAWSERLARLARTLAES